MTVKDRTIRISEKTLNVTQKYDSNIDVAILKMEEIVTNVNKTVTEERVLELIKEKLYIHTGTN